MRIFLRATLPVIKDAACRCLAVKSERIINNSVARLRPHHAAALLEGAVERLRTRARRGTELTVWIRAVLTHHTAYLMAAPGVLPILATLSQVKLLRGPSVVCGAGLWCKVLRAGFVGVSSRGVG